MAILFTNNASAAIASTISSSATSITVASGQGAEFPVLAGSDYFIATLVDSSNNIEIIKVTARSSDTMTVVRGQESTAARGYTVGSLLELRVTAATLNSFAQTSSITTQPPGTNNTSVATTAFVQAAIQTLYPIGSIYASTISTNPNTLFGFGTWVKYSAGRMLVGDGGTFSGTGGSADAVLVQHSHGGLTGTQSADHTHNFSGNTGVENQGHIHQNSATGGSGVVGPYGGPGPDLEEGAGQPNVSYGNMGLPNTTHFHAFSGTTSGTSGNHNHGITQEGVGATNANMPPYQVIYYWTRTA